jgi:hypothetical protein
MTLLPKQQQKNCFIACNSEKINAGLCDCVNIMRNKFLNNKNSNEECVHDYKLDTIKNDILCTKCGLSKYLD